MYFAHSAGKEGTWQTLADHLLGVRSRVETFLEGWHGLDEGRAAALLHDLGKYGERFQRRLKGEERGLDHWSQGAWVALNDLRAVAAALCIEGHHIGLQQMNKSRLTRLAGKLLPNPANLVLSEPNIDLLRARLKADGLAIDSPPTLLGSDLTDDSVGTMLDVRRMFSALVVTVSR